MKSEISRNEYLQLAGLLHLAKVHWRNADQCRAAAIALLDISEEGQGAEACRDEIDVDLYAAADSDVDEVLKRLRVTVQTTEAGSA